MNQYENQIITSKKNYAPHQINNFYLTLISTLSSSLNSMSQSIIRAVKSGHLLTKGYDTGTCKFQRKQKYCKLLSRVLQQEK